MSNTIKFEKPPVVEVVCGVSFQGVDWNELHYGLYYERIRERYSYKGRFAPLPPFTGLGFSRPEFQITEVPELARVWFEGVGRPFLLQVQNNRFLANWRKQGGQEYPKFYGEGPDVKGVWNNFWDEWRVFQAFCEELGAGKPQVTALELLYANHFPKGKYWSEPLDLAKYLSVLSCAAQFPELTHMGMEFGYSKSDMPLWVTLRRGMRQGPEGQDEIFNLEFSAREAVQPDVDVEKWFSRANDALASDFAGLLTERARQEWGLNVHV